MSVHDVTVAEPTVGDGAAMWRVARSVGLDPNSPYKYLLFCRDFARTSVVARAGRGGEVVGFVTAYLRPESSRTVFVWQVGVMPSHRGRGVAGAMLDRVTGSGAVDHLEATVTPDNESSLRTFSSFAARHDAPLERSVLFGAELFPDPHAEEVLLRIGPL